MKNRVSFIGMASSGKSTIGKLFAQQINYDFVDLDVQIELHHKKELSEILQSHTDVQFLEIEFEELKRITSQKNIVISPGGSIIYNEQAMRWLSKNTLVIFLDVPFNIIEARLAEKPKAIVGLREKTLLQIYNERSPLYRKYAHVQISGDGRDVDSMLKEVIKNYQRL